MNMKRLVWGAGVLATALLCVSIDVLAGPPGAFGGGSGGYGAAGSPGLGTGYGGAGGGYGARGAPGLGSTQGSSRAFEPAGAFDSGTES